LFEIEFAKHPNLMVVKIIGAPGESLGRIFI
jgi:hypothetical protein